jgi:hypothetical protein
MTATDSGRIAKALEQIAAELAKRNDPNKQPRAPQLHVDVLALEGIVDQRVSAAMGSIARLATLNERPRRWYQVWRR